MKILISFLVLFSINFSYSQSDFDKIIKSGEVIVNGLSILKSKKTTSTNASGVVESVCVKNKLSDKITFKMTGKDADGNEVKKELVVPKDGSECVYSLASGVWAYEIILSNKEIFKKGEYKLDDEMVITVKEN